MTLQIYLNGESSTLKGGATRLFSQEDSWHDGDDLRGPCVDVPARRGRVLIFAQEKLLHSGEPVIQGVKVTVRTEFMYEVWSQ